MAETPLAKADYEEPRCPLCSTDAPQRIPVGRVIERLDACFAAKDFDAAERHLQYWLTEAQTLHDEQGILLLLSEEIGFYRKCGEKCRALSCAEDALGRLCGTELDETLLAATVRINAATAYQAFGQAEKALPLFEKAMAVYRGCLPADDTRFGGLYNNMALTLAELGRYDEAEERYRAALDIMGTTPGGEPECAVTCCNLADLARLRHGDEGAEKEIEAYLAKAMEFLDTPGLVRDADYCYVCEKCAPVFGYYGFFLWEEELNQRARGVDADAGT